MTVTEDLIGQLALEILTRDKSNHTSQNENPNIINQPKLKLDREEQDENAKKNALFQNGFERSLLCENQMHFLKKQRVVDAELSPGPLLLKTANCDKGKVLNLNEDSQESRLINSMQAISRITAFSDE